MIDFSFIRNRLPENTPVKFRRKHMKGFLHMLHPNFDLDEETLTCMSSNAVEHPISDAMTRLKNIMPSLVYRCIIF